MTEKGIRPDSRRMGKIRARANAATPGPWMVTRNGGMRIYPAANLGKADHLIAKTFGSQWLAPDAEVAAQDNATFIAEARADVVWLLDRLEALETTARDLVQASDAETVAACLGLLAELVDSELVALV